MSYIKISGSKGVFMTSNLQKLKQIVQYNANREYFRDWTPGELSDCFRLAKKSNSATILYVGKLTNDIICDTLWHEMSLNPVRFGTESPFKIDEKNDILYFKNTYKNKIFHDNKIKPSKKVVDLVYKIQSFIENLYNAEQDDDFIDDLGGAKLYTHFEKTGELPTTFRIFDNNGMYEKPNANSGYRILGSLCSAIHLIASQNWQDLKDPVYKEQIKMTVMEKYPFGKRTNVYCIIKPTEQEIKPQNQIKQNILEKPEQELLPFAKLDILTKIDLKIDSIDSKISETKNVIQELEQKLDDIDDKYDVLDVIASQKELERAKHQIAAYYGIKQRLLNKQQKLHDCDVR